MTRARKVEAAPGYELRCDHARFLLMYLHSNAEDIGTARYFGCGVRMLMGMHVFLVEYPGYGICAGECSEESLEATAVLAFRFLTEKLDWPAEDIIVMGRSLGSALATRLACTYDFHGLILVSPFLSLRDAVSEHLGAIAQLVVEDAYKNKDRMCDVRVPTLIIHAVNDRLVPVRHGKELHKLCPNKNKLLVLPQTMGHNGDILRDATLLLHPMLRIFALPDYTLRLLEVPAKAFDKRNTGDMGGGLEDGNGLDGPRAIHQSCPASHGDVIPWEQKDDDLEHQRHLMREYAWVLPDSTSLATRRL